MFLGHIVFPFNEEGRKREGEERFIELETITTREMTSNIRLQRRWCVIISSGKDVVVAQDSMTMDDARHPTRGQDFVRERTPSCVSRIPNPETFLLPFFVCRSRRPSSSTKRQTSRERDDNIVRSLREKRSDNSMNFLEGERPTGNKKMRGIGAKKEK